MKVNSATFHFAGQEKVAQENKTVKSAIPKLAGQSISVSISEEGYESYRNSVQGNGQSLSYDEVIEQRKMLADVSVEKNLNKFEEDAGQHQKAKTIINEWQEQIAEIKGGGSLAQAADSISAVKESNSVSEGIRTADVIMRERSPETAEKMNQLVHDFWTTKDQSYLMQASRLALDWLSENYSKHPEWFGGEANGITDTNSKADTASSRTDTNTVKSGSLPDGRKSFVEIMQENTPETAKEMQEFIHNFWNTGDKSFLGKACRLALDWLSENYSKHPEWFGTEQ